ncbi:MAG: hypothetical protein EB039_11755 [Proteobacteria bacterium]|nr:hypothetical protein [Pseudomonadota bacterium]
MTSASPTRRRHRILMFTGYYLPYISGMTIYAQRLAEGLVRRGHQVTILCSHHDARLPLREDLDGVQVVRSRVLFGFRKGVVMPLFWYDLQRLLRDHDIFHRHVPGLLDAYISTRIARAMHKPVIFTHHCDIYLPFGLLNDAITAAMHTELRYAGELADLIISYSQDYAAYSRFLSHNRSKLRTVFPPIKIGTPDDAQAQAWRTRLGLDGRRIIGFAGRFAADKGGDVLLRARAIENQMFVLGVNRFGLDGKGLKYPKSTTLIDPWGKKVSPTLENRQIGVEIFDLDLEEVHLCRKSFPILVDRVPGFD